MLCQPIGNLGNEDPALAGWPGSGDRDQGGQSLLHPWELVEPQNGMRPLPVIAQDYEGREKDLEIGQGWGWEARQETRSWAILGRISLAPHPGAI
jgi:hypothetical protein